MGRIYFRQALTSELVLLQEDQAKSLEPPDLGRDRPCPGRTRTQHANSKRDDRESMDEVLLLLSL